MSNKHRLIILTDMGNEPDDSQTMVHLLMYANEIDIEGLIAVSSRWLNPYRNPPQNRLYPELIVESVEAYSSVRDNLMKHAPGWPTKEYLLSRTAVGQVGYGMEDVGDGKNTPGSDLIIRALEAHDPRPVYFAINAGSNTLGQALWDIKRTKTQEEQDALIAKVRVYDDAGQDDAGAWATQTFPDIFWARSHSQVFGLYGTHVDEELVAKGPYTWEPYAKHALGQHAWAAVHIQTNHGPLGALYPDRFDKQACLEGGGTSTWLCLVNKGLADPAQISWGGWSGRFTSEKKLNVPSKYHPHLQKPYEPFWMYAQAADTFTGEGLTGFDEWVDDYRHPEYLPIWKWRRAHMNDFRARMDWCVNPPERANHNPVAVFNNDTSGEIVRLQAYPDQVIPLDASASFDPDGDGIRFQWFVYPDPGTYPGKVDIPDDIAAQTALTIPTDAAGAQIHVILQVWDDNHIVPMVDYRRVVIDVSER